ncbi:hypothetical protein B0T17DRAFT_542020 [Bombardia bombarda]|uniref:Uncharacterized protein n=1 Tax=Bombardia bombarda TaxID=252184 RepID=A0AA39T2I5_9PEZI|nr:hypothetical protein B0T17DRAFT_542020 [Bombardia bombarda]
MVDVSFSRLRLFIDKGKEWNGKGGVGGWITFVSSLPMFSIVLLVDTYTHSQRVFFFFSCVSFVSSYCGSQQTHRPRFVFNVFYLVMFLLYCWLVGIVLYFLFHERE